MKNIRSFILTAFVIGIVLISFNSSAQINILPGPDVTPEDMVENIVGEGIMYDNVTFQGADAARGIFTNGSATNLGIESGIFLTSGGGYVIPGPNTSNSAGANNGLAGHPSLNAITTATTYDASVLEFDFVPESDTLRFKYVFGSEEYNEWVFSTFNDVFGYFVTGPDPMGGMYADKNVAIVPGTEDVTVTINNVNNGFSPPGVVPTGPCNYCWYYDDNTGGLSLEYDGFTTVLVAWLLVVPCETYHIKIGVADAGDHIYDTGVFIEENSFESPKIEVEIDPFPQGVSDNMIEGCVEADIIFHLPNPQYAPITVCYEIGGTAINGVDYEEIDDCITFEEGQDTAVIHIFPYKDGIIEGEEDIVLIIENTLGCIVRYDTVIFIIVDYVDMVTSTSPSTMICQGQQIDIWVNTVNGIPPYTYEWDGFSINNDTITVAPDTTTMYYVNVFDLCQDSVIDSIQVTVVPLPEVDIGNDSAVICEGDTLFLNAGGGYLGYLWQDGSTDSIYAVTDPGFYYVIVMGPAGCTNSDSIYVSLIELNIYIGNDTTICIGDSIIFDPGGGYTSYLWQNGSTNQSLIAWETGTYWVQVTLDGCTKTDSIYLYVDDPAIAIELGNDTIICTNDQIVLQPLFGIFNAYLWSTGETTSSITVTLPDTYWLEVESGCGTAYDTITIGNWPEPDPDLGEDLTLCYGETTLLEPGIGYSTYLWQDNTTLPFFSVTQNGIYYVEVTDIHGCVGSDTVYIDVANIVDLGEDLILCTGETITLDAGFGFDYYTWSTGDYGVETIDVTTGGYYSVNVNYYFGCPSEDTIYIEEFPVPEASITGDDMLCEGETITLSGPEGNFTYYWFRDNNSISDQPSIDITQGGNYKLTLENVCGDSTAYKEVTLNPLPDVDLGNDVTLFPGDNIELKPDVGTGNYTYIWIWENGTSSTNTLPVNYSQITNGQDIIIVQITDTETTCENSDEIIVEVFNVEVPIVITPNGDGDNDRFEPGKGWNVTGNHKMIVFNRWGEKVWESSDFTSGWDGKNKNGNYVAEGTYFWVLEVHYGPDNIKKVYKGSLTVLGTGS
ncbi:MAG: gliding motility-associated C-terminal domain-containing protein [Bacteroidales bacterium]|nr:gliding motility-associated C-terminal domain-containing protein [Bacteroidales bacterium]